MITEWATWFNKGPSFYSTLKHLFIFRLSVSKKESRKSATVQTLPNSSSPSSCDSSSSFVVSLPLSIYCLSWCLFSSPFISLVLSCHCRVWTSLVSFPQDWSTISPRESHLTIFKVSQDVNTTIFDICIDLDENLQWKVNKVLRVLTDTLQGIPPVLSSLALVKKVVDDLDKSDICKGNQDDKFMPLASEPFMGYQVSTNTPFYRRGYCLPWFLW